nr:MAG TPA: hypothetical protein [Caudoviricetes sp.]
MGSGFPRVKMAFLAVFCAAKRQKVTKHATRVFF